jgi:hypothetical protein
MKLLIQLQIDLRDLNRSEDANKAIIEATNEYIRDTMEEKFEDDELDAEVVSVKTQILKGTSE